MTLSIHTDDYAFVSCKQLNKLIKTETETIDKETEQKE